MPIDEHLGDPAYNALAVFVVSTLTESLNNLAAWSVQAGEMPTRQFHLRFTDGRSIEGYLRQCSNGGYAVYSFRCGFLLASEVQSVTFHIVANPTN